MDVIEKVEVLVSSPSRNYVTLRLTTRDGIVGLGDATVNGRELAVASFLAALIAAGAVSALVSLRAA